MHAYAYQEEVNLPALAALQRLPAGARVLDVGCGRAQLGEAAQACGLHVTGIEVHPDATSVARGRIERLLEVDLLDLDAVAAALGDERFDALVFSDVLEHVAWPVEVLQSYLRWLVPGGVVVVSVPNVASWDSRLRLLAGSFRYTDSGLMDRTHLRFFTVQSARELLRDAGLKVERTTGDPMIVRAALPIIKGLLGRSAGEGPADPGAMAASPAYRTYKRFVRPVEVGMSALWPGGLWFRIVVEGRAP